MTKAGLIQTELAYLVKSLERDWLSVCLLFLFEMKQVQKRTTEVVVLANDMSN